MADGPGRGGELAAAAVAMACAVTAFQSATASARAGATQLKYPQTIRTMRPLELFIVTQSSLAFRYCSTRESVCVFRQSKTTKIEHTPLCWRRSARGSRLLQLASTASLGLSPPHRPRRSLCLLSKGERSWSGE